VWQVWARHSPLALQYFCVRMFHYSGAPRIQTACCSDREYVFSGLLSAGVNLELFVIGGGADPEAVYKLCLILKIMF